MRRQCIARGVGILLDEVRKVALADPGQRVQRQAQAHRRITGHEVHALIAEEPGAGDPPRAGQARATAGDGGLDGQHVAHGGVELLLEHAAQAGAFHLVVEFGIERVYVDGQAALAPQVVPGVFIRSLDVLVGEAQLGGQGAGKVTGVFAGVVGGVALVGEQCRVAPHRLLVGTPVDVQCPAWQLLAGVPLALAKVQESTLAVFVAQLVHQCGGKATLGGAQSVGVPFGRVAVVDGHERGLTAHGQAHIASDQLGVHLVAQRHDIGPLLGRVGLGDAGRFVNAGHLHVVAELHLGLVHATLNRRCARRLGCAGQRNMAFAGQQAAGGVQANPASAGQIDLAPGVQVGEVDLGAAGAVERLHIGCQLDQVAGNKARSQPAVAQQLHHQPG